jgi:hypothetical protein
MVSDIFGIGDSSQSDECPGQHPVKLKVKIMNQVKRV